jgi:hypothetical protein
MTRDGRAEVYGGRLHNVRIWLSYQRYALALVLFAALLPLISWLAYPTLWGVWGAAIAIGLCCLIGAHKIGSKFRHKLRVTAMLQRRYKRNGFTEEGLRHYSEDPCYRVVSNEIMCQAGVPAPERRAILTRLKREARLPVVYRPNTETGVLERVPIQGKPAP